MSFETSGETTTYKGTDAPNDINSAESPRPVASLNDNKSQSSSSMLGNAWEKVKSNPYVAAAMEKIKYSTWSKNLR